MTIEFLLMMVQVLVFCFGACVGSFLNVAIARLPKGESVIKPRSQCPQCKSRIAWYQNIPLLSFLYLRGHCAKCKAKISWRYFVVELVTALLFVYLFRQTNYWIAIPFHIYFIAALIASTFIDLEHWIIPDKITLPGIVIGLLGSLLIPYQEPLLHLLGAFLGGFSLFSIAWVYERLTKREGLGGGDIKFLAMIGAFLGPQGVAITMIVSSLVGALAGFVVMAITKQGLKTAIPFGPFLALGALLAFFFGEQIWYWYFNQQLL